MPVDPSVSYPGVYIQESPSEVRTILGVETATTAFLGLAERGPVDSPVVIHSFSDFQAIFGGLWSKSKLGFAIQDFFRNGGSKAIVVRIVPLAGATHEFRTAEGKLLAAEQTDPKPSDDLLESLRKDAESIKARMASRATFSLDTLSSPEQELQAVRLIQNERRTRRALARAPRDRAAIAAARLAQKAVADFNAALPKLHLQATSPGEWGNHLRIRVAHSLNNEFSQGVARQLGANVRDLFDLWIHDSSTGRTEAWGNLTLVPGARQIKSVLEQGSQWLRVAGEDVPTIGRPAKVDVPPNDRDTWENAVKPDRDGIGSDGAAASAEDVIGNADLKTGMYALEHADLFNLLCIPPFADDGSDVPGQVWEQALAYCRQRRALLLVDPPSKWKSKDSAKDLAGAQRDQLLPASDNYAALYFPRIMEPNPLRGNQVEEFVPCGAIAGVIARTDTTRGVWKAPAGTEAVLLGVTALSVVLTDADIRELNPLGVNCLRTTPTTGHVVWGARTMEGDDRLSSIWKYLPVRRTALFIEESLYRGTQWAVFEPNDEPLWDQLRLQVGAFLQNLFRQGAFQGRSPQEAYFVKCDAVTTAQMDIDRGIVNIVVGFAPLKPAEFVVMYIRQVAGQVPA